MTKPNTPQDPADLLTQSAWVRRLAQALVVGPDADDVVQQTYLAALEKRPSKKVLNLKAWLSGVTRRVIRDRNRSEVRRQRREYQSVRSELLPSTEEMVERAELHRGVVQAVLQLHEPYRSTLLLRFFEDRSAEEIAAHLQVPSSTVRNRVHRGVELLRQHFLQPSRGSNKTLAGLVALAFPGLEAKAALALTAGSLSSAGGTTMTIKLLALLAMLSGGSVSTWLWVNPGDHEPSQARVLPALSQEAQDPNPGDEGPDDKAQPQRKPLPEHRVAGVVTNGKGEPLAGTAIFIGGQPNPFADPADRLLQLDGTSGEREWDLKPESATAEELRERNLVAGRWIYTDKDGRFEALFPEAGKVYVTVAETFAVRPETDSGGWKKTPDDQIRLQARQLPMARVRISLTDATTGESLQSFGAIYREDSNGRVPRVHRWYYKDGTAIEQLLELPSNGLTTFRFKIMEPYYARQEVEARLGPGADQAIQLVAESGQGFEGQVIGPDGAPLANAMVFWGTQRRMRGEWDWSPFRPEQIPDAALSDESGNFKLPGFVDQVTVWHPQTSPITLASSQARKIQLRPRASVKGRLVDATGQPLASKTILLDNLVETETDEGGRFVFASVEAGVHRLIPKEQSENYQLSTGIQLSPGETLELEIQQEEPERNLELFSGGRRLAKETRGWVVGLDQVYTLQGFRVRDGVVKVRGNQGRALVYSNQGMSTVFNLADDSSRVELGSLSLEVIAPPDRRVSLLPDFIADANKFARDLIKSRWQKVPTSGRLTYSNLPPGRYEIHTVEEGRVSSVEVREATQEIEVLQEQSSD